MCGKTEYTLLYALWLLRGLAEKVPQHGPVLLRLCDELDCACTDRFAAKVWALFQETVGSRRDLIGRRCVLLSQDSEGFVELIRPLS